jgi:hypothetical protein
MEKLPKTEKKPIMSNHEAEIKLINEISINFSMLMFAELEKVDAGSAINLKNAYDEFTSTYVAMTREASTRQFSIREVAKRIPNNEWLKLLREASEFIPKHEMSETDAVNWREDVERTKKGNNVN